MKATLLCQQGNQEDAVKEIEIAIADEEEKNNMFTWYSRGFIYKEFYKSKESTDPNSASRKIAVESFLKSRKMADKETETIENHDLALKYLAITYYNDAIRSIGQIQKGDETAGDNFFNEYCRILSEINGDENCESSKSEFYRARGQRFADLWAANESRTDLWERAVTSYESAITFKPQDCSSHYNILVLLCNRMVSLRNGTEENRWNEIRSLLEKADKNLLHLEPYCKNEETFRNGLDKAKTIINDIRAESATHETSPTGK